MGWVFFFKKVLGLLVDFFEGLVAFRVRGGIEVLVLVNVLVICYVEVF